MAIVDVLDHREFVADSDTAVEPVNCRHKYWQGRRGVLRAANDKEETVTRILVNGKINTGTKGIVERTLADVVDYSNDMVERAGGEILIADGLSDGVFPVKELLRHGPVDDDHGWMRGVVRFSKEPPFEQAGLEGRDVVGAYGTGPGHLLRATPWPAQYAIGDCVAVAIDGQVLADDSRRLNAGDGGNRFHYAARERELPSRIVVPGIGVDLKRGEVGGVEVEIDVENTVEALAEESGGGEEDDGKCQLDNNKVRAEASPHP